MLKREEEEKRKEWLTFNHRDSNVCSFTHDEGGAVIYYNQGAELGFGIRCLNHCAIYNSLKQYFMVYKRSLRGRNEG